MNFDNITDIQINSDGITELRINGILVWEKNTISNDLVLSFTGSNFSVGSSSQGLTGQNIVINWGDGTKTNYSSASDLNHTYSASGDYSITISKVIGLEASCFLNCTGLTSINIPDSVISLGSQCFRGCSGLTNVVIPNSITSLESSCFSLCSSLTSIIIPDSVTSIGSNCFARCSGLTNIVMSNNVTSLGDFCFLGCSNLTNVIIPDSVISLGYQCFKECSHLTSIEIPEGVTNLGNGCFNNCSRLTSLICNWESNPPSYNSNWITSANSSLKFSIPYGTTSIYTDAGYPSDKLVEREDPYLSSITSDKDILSYYDNDVANLTVNYTKNETPYDGVIYCSTFPDFFDGTNLYIPFEKGDEDWTIMLNGTFDILNEDKTLYNTLTSSQVRYVRYQNGVVTTAEFMQDAYGISLPTKGFFLVTPQQLMDSTTGFVSLGGPSFDIRSMSNGVMNVSYNSKGVGDVTFYFFLDDGTLLQETYELEDCIIYDESEYSWVSGTSETFHDMYPLFDFDANNDFELYIDFYQSSALGCVGLNPVNQETTLKYHLSYGQSQGGTALYWGNSGGTETAQRHSESGIINQWLSIKFIKIGNTISIYRNNVLYDSITDSEVGKHGNMNIGVTSWSTSKTLKVKNLKLKSKVDNNITPVINNITLISDKSVLSAYDSDTCTLTATVTGENVDGLTVEFFNGTTSLGTAIVSNGVATKSYSATGAGDISVSAQCGETTSNAITVEDCLYHNDGTNLSNVTIGSGVSCTVSDGALRITKSTSGEANVTIPKTFTSSDNFVAEWEVACTGTTQRSAFWLYNATSANGLWCCYENGYFTGNSKAGTISRYTTSLNVGDKIYLKQENGVVTLSKNNETFFSKSISFSGSYRFGYYTNNGRVQCVDNIKIKPII